MGTENASTNVSAHYGKSDLEAGILAGLRAAGKEGERLLPADLAPVDQFHIGGRNATLDLARRAGIRANTRVLDVGGGLGGPARTLAAEFGCHVTVLDLTEEYCRVGAMLTERVGLTDRVTFRHGSALDLPFAAGEFDVAWTQHSSMNIDDKPRLYAEIHRVLRPRGRLALHEVVAGAVQPIHFPAPWAREPSISFLRSVEQMRDVITTAGFTELMWEDESAAVNAYFQRNVDSVASGQPPPLGLHLLLGADFEVTQRNMLRNLAEGRIAVVKAVFDRRD